MRTGFESTLLRIKLGTSEGKGELSDHYTTEAPSVNFQKVCAKSLLFLVSKSYKELCQRMIKQLLNSVLAKYRDSSVVGGIGK